MAIEQSEPIATDIPVVSLTERATDKLREIIAKQDRTGLALRVYVTPGGCSGFSYGMTFADGTEEDDTIVEMQGVRVVYLTDNHLPNDAEFAMFPPHALVGTKGAEVVPELAPANGDVVITKRRYSGFFGTDLDITLRERGVDTLRLVGDCTNICVLYTAADARNLGYAVEVLQDAVTSFDEEAHRDALRELEKTLGATILR